jgi:hypothetical protein
MELWQALLVAFGGNATLLLVLGFLGRSVVKSVLAKDLEEFKAKLALTTVEHQVRFSTLHEKRAEVLAELYKLLVRAVREAETFAFPVEMSGEPDRKQKFVNAFNSNNEYLRFFDEHRIYVSTELCTSLEEFGRRLRAPTIRLGVSDQWEHPNKSSAKEAFQAWRAAWESVEKEVPPLRRALEEEIRVLLGVVGGRPS